MQCSVRATVQLYSVTTTSTLYTAVMGSMGRPLAVCPGQVTCSDTVLIARAPSWNVTALLTASVKGPRWLVEPEENVVNRPCCLTALASVVQIIWRRTQGR